MACHGLAGDLHGGDLYKLDGSQLIDTSTSTIKNMTIQAGDGTSAYNPTTKLFNGDLIGNFQGDIFIHTGCMKEGMRSIDMAITTW